jgi:hypothetical protein
LNRKDRRPYVIVNQAEEGRGVRQDGGGVDVDLVAAVHERSEVHLEGSSDMIEGDPLVYDEPDELIARAVTATYSS